MGCRRPVAATEVEGEDEIVVDVEEDEDVGDAEGYK